MKITDLALMAYQLFSNLTIIISKCFFPLFLGGGIPTVLCWKTSHDYIWTMHIYPNTCSHNCSHVDCKFFLKKKQTIRSKLFKDHCCSYWFIGYNCRQWFSLLVLFILPGFQYCFLPVLAIPFCVLPFPSDAGGSISFQLLHSSLCQ